MFLAPPTIPNFTIYALIVNSLIIEGHFVVSSTLSQLQGMVWMACVAVVLTGRAAYALHEDVLGSLIDLSVCLMAPLAIILIWNCLKQRVSPFKELLPSVD